MTLQPVSYHKFWYLNAVVLVVIDHVIEELVILSSCVYYCYLYFMSKLSVCFVVESRFILCIQSTICNPILKKKTHLSALVIVIL